MASRRRTVQYCEQVLEDLVAADPCGVLGEHLTLVDRQVRLDRLRPDLLFTDEIGMPVVVEVQINALDRNHLYRALEYRDALIDERGYKQVRVMLVCNDLEEHQRKPLQRHQVEVVVISREETIQRASTIWPELRIVDRRKKSAPSLRQFHPKPLTASDILTKLAKRKRREVPGTIDAILFHIPTWKNSRYTGWRLRNFDLRMIANTGELSCNDLDGQVRIHDELGEFLIDPAVPAQIVVDGPALRDIRVAQVRACVTWLEFLDNCRDNIDGKDYVVLGGRDLAPYDWYIKGRVRKFEPLLSQYQGGFDAVASRITDDLHALQSLRLYSGMSTSLQPLAFCTTFSVEQGPGPLGPEVQRDVRDYHDYWIRQYGCENKPHDQWTTVWFDGLDSLYIDVMLHLLHHLMSCHEPWPEHETKIAEDSWASHWKEWDKQREIERPVVMASPLDLDRPCHHCLIAPKSLATTDSEALALSDRYFAHVRQMKDRGYHCLLWKFID